MLYRFCHQFLVCIARFWQAFLDEFHLYSCLFPQNIFFILLYQKFVLTYHLYINIVYFLLHFLILLQLFFSWIALLAIRLKFLNRTSHCIVLLVNHLKAILICVRELFVPSDTNIRIFQWKRLRLPRCFFYLFYNCDIWASRCNFIFSFF